MRHVIGVPNTTGAFSTLVLRRTSTILGSGLILDCNVLRPSHSSCSLAADEFLSSADVSNIVFISLCSTRFCSFLCFWQRHFPLRFVFACTTSFIILPGFNITLSLFSLASHLSPASFWSFCTVSWTIRGNSLLPDFLFKIVTAFSSSPNVYELSDFQLFVAVIFAASDLEYKLSFLMLSVKNETVCQTTNHYSSPRRSGIVHFWSSLPSWIKMTENFVAHVVVSHVDSQKPIFNAWTNYPQNE